MGSLLRHEKLPWIETPLVESSVLSRAAGCRVFLKLENLQPSSSFKSRGLGNLMLHHLALARKSPEFSPESLHFYSSSGGNAGLAVVEAAKALGLKSTVVVPLSTEESIIIKIKAAGATQVVRHGHMWAVADEYLRQSLIPAEEQRGEKCIYVPPFDDPLIWEGCGIMVEEIRRQMPNDSAPDAIVCSVGGGGLFCGIMNGLDRVGWGEHVDVIACETEGADALARSLQAGELITLPDITSIAKSLGAARVCDQAFKYAQRATVQSVVLHDSEACEGAWRFADDERMLVEPACGVTVALAYRGRLARYLKNFTPESKVVLVVCGGSRVTLAEMEGWKQKFGRMLADDEEGEAGKVPSSSSVDA